MAEFWPCKIASHSWTMSTEQYLRTRGRKEAEPMDLSDEAFFEQASSIAQVPPGWGRLTDAIERALRLIRDAATAAERARAIAMVEQQIHYSETAKWVKDQILAALRGGDHE